MIDLSHVYVEEAARDLPLTRSLLDRLQPEHVTVIEDAQRFFKRPAQDFARQKRAPRLIVARKTDRFIYRGSERVASFGVERDVHYNDMLRNCLFDCDYCFLQGMHRSANILLNANIEDYVSAVDQRLANKGALYLSVSYLTDLMGFERSFGLARRWIDIARTRPGLEVELRTKSDAFGALADLEPHRGIVFTWSLSPDAVARRHEAGTAAFQQRLLDARRAAQRGWRVRICFDPIIVTEHWRQHYTEAVDHLFRRVPAEFIEELSFGVFRMHPDFLDRILAFRSSSSLEQGVQRDKQVASYTERMRREVFALMREQVGRHLPPERMHGVHG